MCLRNARHYLHMSQNWLPSRALITWCLRMIFGSDRSCPPQNQTGFGADRGVFSFGISKLMIYWLDGSNWAAKIWKKNEVAKALRHWTNHTAEAFNMWVSSPSSWTFADWAMGDGFTDGFNTTRIIWYPTWVLTLTIQACLIRWTFSIRATPRHNWKVWF